MQTILLLVTCLACVAQTTRRKAKLAPNSQGGPFTTANPDDGEDAQESLESLAVFLVAASHPANAFRPVAVHDSLTRALGQVRRDPLAIQMGDQHQPANNEFIDDAWKRYMARRQLLTTLLAAAASTKLGLAPAKALSPAAVVAAEGATAALGKTTVYKVASAALDRRSYRGLVLANGLRVLLASDPLAAKGAASMDVAVGYLTDPVGLPGLAHFCEHMLFLGTKAFPKEGDFEQYLTAGSGSNNAYTASEDTNYFFDVQGNLLPGAIERFAAFFTSPLFTKSATEREVNAIESEHTKNLQSDYWRYDQLLKLRANQSHPYAKFGTGNRQTLRNGNDETRAALLEYHSRYYQADAMSLALTGPQNLDALQALAEKNFAEVPTSAPPLPGSSNAYDGLPLPFVPARDAPTATVMVPVNDVRSLKFVWCLPVDNLDNWFASKPEGVWELLVQNRGEGGLAPLLKRKGLANSIGAQVEEYTRAFMLLNVGINLTPLGVKEWRSVSSLVFAYFRTLAAAGVPGHLVDEFAKMKEILFEYAEPARPEDFARSASGALEFFEPEKWITGPVLADPSRGSAKIAKFMLDWVAQPRNAIITLMAKDVALTATQTEPIYGTKYGTVPIQEEVRAWSTSKAPAELGPPKPNPFLPTDLSLRCGNGASAASAEAVSACQGPPVGEASPTLIEARTGLAMHFLQDRTFRRPKAYAYFVFRASLYDSPSVSITSQLYQRMLGDYLQESTYQAGLAGLGAGIGTEPTGLYVTALGFNSRLGELVKTITPQLKTAPLEPLTFDRVRESLRQDLANAKRRQPIGLCSYYRGLTIERPKFTIEELTAAVENVTLADIKKFQADLLPKAYFEAFVIGNVDEAEARALSASAQAALPSAAPLAAEDIPHRRVRRVPKGRKLQQYVAPNPDEKNSATEVYLQVGLDEGDDWLLCAVIGQLIDQPFFGDLRTKQQLGYIVQSGITEAEGVRGFIFSVQSAVLPPPEVEKRIDTFLVGFRETLLKISDTQLKGYLDALAAEVTDVDKRLGAQAARMWSEILRRRYDYGRPWRTAKRFKKVTRKQLLAFWDACLAPGAPNERRLSTHVFNKASEPTTLVVEGIADDFFAVPPDRFVEVPKRYLPTGAAVGTK